MKIAKPYVPEAILLAGVTIVSVLGFWGLYFGAGADPQPHHHLHLVTVFVWLSLLLVQLGSIAQGSNRTHRKVGLAVLVIAPLLVATTASLSVLSARRAAGSGEADFLLVQNVMVSLQLGLLITLAFRFRRRRTLHGAMLFATLILFGGIALFFALLGFVPMFEIEGPETFYRFGTASVTALGICLAVGAALFVSAPMKRWPYLLAAGFFVLNDAINQSLVRFDLASPATQIVGSFDPILMFGAAFVIEFVLLAVVILPRRSQGRSEFAPKSGEVQRPLSDR